jgi:glycolate oxidase FAD binding subunit
MPEVVTPGSVAEVSSALRDAGGRAVVARGAGTKLDWGSRPRRCDLVVDLSRLDRILDHAAGDMVVRVQAGVPLHRLTERVAGAGQQLAVDVPGYDDGTVLDAGTVGGALAVAAGGPRRLRYGGLRDLLLGVTVVRADGAVAASGGRVVKNVAGYDLGKLLCGSYGTLGVVVAAILRLHPLPAATGWVTTRASDPATAYGRARALLDSQFAASAVELDRPGGGEPVTVAALFEGTGDGVASRAEAAAGLVGGTAGGKPPAWFGRFPGGPGGVLVEVRFPPAGLVGVLDLVDAAARGSGLPAVVRGSTGPAALQVGLAAEPEPLAGFLSHLRDGLARYGGHALVRHAPEPVRAAVDVWGPFEAGTLRLMQRVKDQFDPDHRLAPGSFLRGI